MSSEKRTASAATRSAPPAKICSTATAAARSSLAGDHDALYERHLMFDNVIDPGAAGARERYEAIARSVRDILSQRWLRTEQTYAARTPSASTTSPWSS